MQQEIIQHLLDINSHFYETFGGVFAATRRRIQPGIRSLLPRLRTALALLASGDYPSRNPQQNLADLKAQIAANEKGVQELRRMAGQFGLSVVQAYRGHVQDNAEESVRRVIRRLKDGAFTLALDNGAQIQVAIRVDAKSRSATIDFTGTSPQQTNNFNAPTAVCMAAVLYVFRTLVRGISFKKSGPEPGRPESADRCQRERRAGTAQDGGPVWPRCRAGLHAPRAGQR